MGRLQRAIERFDLEAYVEEHFEDIRHAANGTELRVNCFSPKGCNGDDYNHKLYINPGKKQWICFKCGYGKKDTQPGTGSLIRLMADVEGLHPVQVRHRLLETVDPTPAEEFEDVLRMAFEDEEKIYLGNNKKPKQERTITIPSCFYKLQRGCGRYARPYLQYLQYRGLSIADAETYNMYFCGTTNVPKDMKQWRNRIIFPIYDLDGKLRSAVGRALPSIYHSLRPARAKWVNWLDTDIGDLLWPLGYFAKGSWISAAMYDTVPTVLSEGIFDAKATWLSGFPGRCTFGKKISDGQIELLKQLEVKAVVLAWDKDAKDEIKAATAKLLDAFDHVSVFPFRDPCWVKYDLGDALTSSISPERIGEEIRQAVRVDSPEFIGWLHEE